MDLPSDTSLPAKQTKSRFTRKIRKITAGVQKHEPFCIPYVFFVQKKDIMKPKILIVEDEPAITDTIQYALETDGFDTVTLSSGMSVIPLISENPVDLIVLDIGLPDINGLELCKEIRKIHTIPIIFLTARADEIDRVVGLEIGADDYLTKPFSPRELSARVKAVLRRTQHTPPSTLSVPAFTVNESKCRISYFDKILDLSHYEYKILKTFIRRPGHVYSRDQLMDLVWDEPETSMDRTVDAHIKNIRAKLKTVKPDMDPIVTHRGMGYSLKEEL
jgi:two-component system catabolic regulation response regulator CreB